MKLSPLFPRNSLLTWICAFSSVLLLLLILTLALHLYLGLGHWPRPMIDTYDTIAFKTHVWLTYAIAHFALFMAIPTWPLLLLFKRFRATVRTHVAQSLVYSAGWLAIYLFLKFGPASFSKWLLNW